MQTGILTQLILPISLFFIMFGMGLSLRINDFTRVLTYPKAFIVGLFAQLMALPMIAFITAISFQLPPELAVGLMIIAFAPGGATSNMFTNIAKGDVALSISLTAIVSLITPFTIPIFTVFSMQYFMGNGETFIFPIIKTIIQLLTISVVPVILGMLVLNKWQGLAHKLEPKLRAFSVFFLLLIIVAVFVKNKENLADFFIQTGAASLTLNILALAFGYYLAKFFKLSHPQSISVGYEVGLQNGALALLIAGTLIGNNTMMIPAVTYSTFMLLTGVGFGYLLNKHLTKQSAE